MIINNWYAAGWSDRLGDEPVPVRMLGCDFVLFREKTLVEFAAKGENVPVAWLGYGMKIESGSSFAAPRVTGLLARLLSVAPNLPPAHVLDLLHRIAEPWREEHGTG